MLNVCIHTKWKTHTNTVHLSPICTAAHRRSNRSINRNQCRTQLHYYQCNPVFCMHSLKCTYVLNILVFSSSTSDKHSTFFSGPKILIIPRNAGTARIGYEWNHLTAFTKHFSLLQISDKTIPNNDINNHVLHSLCIGDFRRNCGTMFKTPHKFR